MSDATPKPAAAAQKKKHLLDNTAVKFLFALLGYGAPVPVLMALIQLWLEYLAGPERQSDALSVFRQYFHGGGNPPYFLLPFALVPSLLLFAVLFRGDKARLIALVAVPVAGLLEAICFLQFFLT